MTLYDLSQWLVQASRGLLVVIGLMALFRILTNRYRAGDTVRFALGIAGFAAINAFFMRIHYGLVTFPEEGSFELIASNFFYTFTVIILVFIVAQETKALK